jgi:hypothetical protein
MTSKAWFNYPGLLLAVAAMAFATGCYRTWIRVVQTVPIEKPRQRVFVVVHEGFLQGPFAHDLSRDISAKLGRHVTTQGIVVTGVEFESGPVDRKIAAFGAECVLVVKPLGIRTGGQYGTIRYLSFSATLLDQPSNQAIWAAKAEADGAGPYWAIAEDIVGSLAASRMIPPAPESPRPSRPIPRTGESVDSHVH